jgi:benzoyl-CoA 2,3-dioxygenase component B
MQLSHVAFHRQIGLFAGTHATPTGELLSEGEWKRRSGDWLPSADDKTFIESLMKPEWTPGQYANWIAEPKTKINHKPGTFEWVKLAAA